MKERAAGCMEAMGEFARAASKSPGLLAFLTHILLVNLGIWAEKSRHEKAAGLFEAGEKYSEAAEEYHKAALTSKALQALYNGKLFDQLVRDLNRYYYPRENLREIQAHANIDIARISRMENERCTLENATSFCGSQR